MGYNNEPHVPFMIITPPFTFKYLVRLKPFGKALCHFFPRLKHDLKKSEFTCNANLFLVSAFLSSLIFGLLFAAGVYALSIFNENSLQKTIFVTALTALVIWFLLFFIYTKYPSIISRKIAADIDKHLIFAVKDLLMYTSSGSSLFNSMLNVSEAGYGRISYEFEKVAREINAGSPTDDALEHMAKVTDSEYLKKVVWQLVNTIRVGGNLKQALDIIVQDLTSAQRASIINYANELNLWSLVYMLFAVAIPTIGLTMMIILSSFADLGLSNYTLIIFLVFTTIVQLAIIGFIKARRPMVEF